MTRNHLGNWLIQVANLFELASDLEDQVLGLMTLLEQIQEKLSQMTVLHPESLSYASLEHAD